MGFDMPDADFIFHFGPKDKPDRLHAGLPTGQAG